MTKRSFIGERRPTTARDVRKIPDVQQTADLSLTEALDIFIRAREAVGLRASTLREYQRHMEYLAEYLRDQHGLSDARVSDLSPVLIREYIVFMRREQVRYKGVQGRETGVKGLSVNTINIRLRSLRALCNFLHAEGLAATNPMATIKNVVDDESEEVPGLTDAEIERLLASLDVRQYAEWRDKVLIMLLLDTGLRIEEAVSLSEDRVDFRMLTLLVPSQIAKNRRNREIPISREVAKMLRQLHEETKSYFGDAPGIFYNAYGDPYTADAFRKRLSRRKKRIGLDRLHPHMFRHTFARNYLLNGGDLFTLQRILDHAEISTTRKYVQMDDADVRAQHNKYSPVRRFIGRR